VTSNAIRRVRVLLSGVIIGELIQGRDGGVRWLPDRAWEAGGQVPRLGFDFLREPGLRKSSQELPPWFENLLPERESALRARFASIFGLRDGQSFELLNKLGRELPGAVEVVCPDDSACGDLEGFPDAATAVPLEDSTSPSRRHGDARLSSLAGVQLKFGMSMVNERLAFGARSGAREWIVKFPGVYPCLAEIETTTMTWAAQAGFDVPPHRTVPFDELDGFPQGWAERTQNVFAIERFDRRSEGSRVHHEDLCQALGFRPLNKYGDRPNSIRFEGVFRFVHDACGEQSSREFARRLGLMIATGNTDAHLKNWGLLWGDRVRPTLVPCYDIVSTIAFEKMGWDRRGGPRLALRFGTTHRFADIDDKMLDRFSAATGCSWATEEICAGIERARNAYRVLRVTIPPAMALALSEHWNRVPVLRRYGPLRGSQG